MSVLDRFLNIMKLNDEEEPDEDQYLDDPVSDMDDEVRPRRRVIREREEDDPFGDSASEPVRETPPRQKSTGLLGRAKNTSTPKIAPIRQRRKGDGGMEVCVIRPHTMEDAREITETLLANCTVVLNVEGLELEIAQRIIDFASGSCYAIDGNLQKISNYIFIITPESVDISGDFQEILSGAFDVPLENRY